MRFRSQPSEVTGFRGHRIQRSQDSEVRLRLQRSQASEVTGFRGHRLQRSQASEVTGFRGHRLQRSQASEATGFRGHRLLMCPPIQCSIWLPQCTCEDRWSLHDLNDLHDLLDFPLSPGQQHQI
ncbi:hypothetical protein EMCRGX_G017480 [Ephydatia muelleri]